MVVVPANSRSSVNLVAAYGQRVESHNPQLGCLELVADGRVDDGFVAASPTACHLKDPGLLSLVAGTAKIMIQDKDRLSEARFNGNLDEGPAVARDQFNAYCLLLKNSPFYQANGGSGLGHCGPLGLETAELHMFLSGQKLIIEANGLGEYPTAILTTTNSQGVHKITLPLGPEGSPQWERSGESAEFYLAK